MYATFTQLLAHATCYITEVALFWAGGHLWIYFLPSLILHNLPSRWNTLLTTTSLDVIIYLLIVRQQVKARCLFVHLHIAQAHIKADAKKPRLWQDRASIDEEINWYIRRTNIKLVIWDVVVEGWIIWLLFVCEKYLYYFYFSFIVRDKLFLNWRKFVTNWVFGCFSNNCSIKTELEFLFLPLLKNIKLPLIGNKIFKQRV